MSNERRYSMQIGMKMLNKMSLGESEDEAFNNTAMETAQWLIRRGVPAEPMSILQEAAWAHVYSSYSWAKNGFPTLFPSHRLAASWMATKIPQECVPDIHLPWDAFAISIPVEFFPETPIVHVTIQKMSDNDDKMLMVVRYENHTSRQHLATTVGFRSISHLANETLVLEPDHKTPVTGSVANRTMTLLSRLILGLCIELDQPKYRETICRGTPPKRRSGPEPRIWAFQVTRDVSVDCRAYVLRFVSGVGTSPNVQVCVIGHTKRQVCGPGGSDRKIIHIEPYWRGPDDAPIAVRSHTIDP